MIAAPRDTTTRGRVAWRCGLDRRDFSYLAVTWIAMIKARVERVCFPHEPFLETSLAFAGIRTHELAARLRARQSPVVSRINATHDTVA